MQANLKKIRKQRKFSDDFKREIVESFETGKYSVGELGRLHAIAPQNIYQWIYKFSTYNQKGYRMIEHTDSSSKKLKELESKIKSLEAVIGQKQIKIDFLEKMIDIAKEELDIDIKKNYSTPQSNISKQTEKK